MKSRPHWVRRVTAKSAAEAVRDARAALARDGVTDVKLDRYFRERSRSFGQGVCDVWYVVTFVPQKETDMTTPTDAPQFDFYRAENKLAKLREDADRWLGKLLKCSSRVLALRRQVRGLERRILAAREAQEPKPPTTADVLDALRVNVLRALEGEDPANAIPEIFDDVQDALEKKEARRG